MPRFFFHVRGADERLSCDELGLDYPNEDTAYLAAFRAAKDLRGEFAVRGESPQDYVIAVANASHQLVFNLPFAEVFDE
jgi:hypothetical protein